MLHGAVNYHIQGIPGEAKLSTLHAREPPECFALAIRGC